MNLAHSLVRKTVVGIAISGNGMSKWSTARTGVEGTNQFTWNTGWKIAFKEDFLE